MSENIEVVVGALILNEKDEALLIKSPKWQGRYVFPGGHINYGETIVDAAIREVKEETGIDVEDVNIVRFGELIFPKEFYKKKHFIFFHVVCKAKSTEVTLNDEAEAYSWLDINNKNNFTERELETVQKYQEMK